jgi:predicted alpha/beta superfamily hydrolase
MNMSLALVYLIIQPFLVLEASETSDFTLPKIQVVPIKDTQFDRQYELYIKLPEGYSEDKNNHKKYPVIYISDAIWSVEILSGATEYIMEDAILVGVSWQKDIDEALKKDAGEHVSRFRDYSFIKSSKPKHQAKYKFGQASGHLDFIRNDVIKRVERNYRTDPENSTYFGYSMGGLFGTYILLTQPDTFKNYILGSPSLKRVIPQLSELLSNTALKGKGLNANVFLSYGSQEKELGESVEEFITILKSIDDKSLFLTNLVIEGSHQTAFPRTVVRSVTWLSKLSRVKK